MTSVEVETDTLTSLPITYGTSAVETGLKNAGSFEDFLVVGVVVFLVVGVVVLLVVVGLGFLLLSTYG